MYCPECGVKNESPGASCFVCGHTLPGGGSPAAGGNAAKATSGKRGLHPKLERKRGRKSPKLELGSLGDRALATWIDRIVLAALATIPLALSGGGWFVHGSPFSSFGTWALGSLFGFVVIFTYHFLFEWLAGTTAGKILFGLRVVNDGERPDAAAFSLRTLLRIVDGLAFGLVGFLVAYLDPGRRRLGDLAGGTRVVHVPLKTGEKVALLITVSVLAVGAVFIAHYLCEGCAESVSERVRLWLLEMLGSPGPAV